MDLKHVRIKIVIIIILKLNSRIDWGHDPGHELGWFELV